MPGGMGDEEEPISGGGSVKIKSKRKGSLGGRGSPLSPQSNSRSSTPSSSRSAFSHRQSNSQGQNAPSSGNGAGPGVGASTMAQTHSSSSAQSAHSSGSAAASPTGSPHLAHGHVRWHTEAPPSSWIPSHARGASSSHSHSNSVSDSPAGTPTISEAGDRTLTPEQAHYVSAYTPAELRTFHCDRVRKMPLSGLDPSMLLGFLVKNADEWADLRKRIVDVSILHTFRFPRFLTQR
jgi:cysteine protease ATG4